MARKAVVEKQFRGPIALVEWWLLDRLSILFAWMAKRLWRWSRRVEDAAEARRILKIMVSGEGEERTIVDE